jgi:hypothetical protein
VRAGGLPFNLSLQAEALHLAGHTSEALEAIDEAEALAERFDQRGSLSRLNGHNIYVCGNFRSSVQAAGA